MQKLNGLVKYPWGFSAKYTIQHSTPGADGTTLEVEATLEIASEGVVIKLDGSSAKANTPNEAFLKMADNLERLAKALREPPTKTLTIPV